MHPSIRAALVTAAAVAIFGAVTAAGIHGVWIGAMGVAVAAFIGRGSSPDARLLRAGMVILTLYLSSFFTYSAAPEAARRVGCANNLRALGAALRSYEARHGAFPPAVVYDAQGRPMHSWRVLILPDLDRNDLFEQYDFDEPWDSPHNRQLADLMPAVYRCPGDAPSAEGLHTNYVAVAGPQTLWQAERRLSLEDLAEMRETLLITETFHTGIHWMEPRDLTVDELADPPQPKVSLLAELLGIAAEPLPRHGTWGRNCLFADGHIKYLPHPLPRETLAALAAVAAEDRIPREELVFQPPTNDGSERVWFVVRAAGVAVFLVALVALGFLLAPRAPQKG